MLYVQLEYSWSTADNVETNNSCNLHLQCGMWVTVAFGKTLVRRWISVVSSPSIIAKHTEQSLNDDLLNMVTRRSINVRLNSI